MEEHKPHFSRLNETSEIFTYLVQGKSQTRVGTIFIENEYSSTVHYKEVVRKNKRFVTYQEEDFQQTCTGLVFQLTAILNRILSNYEVRLNENYEVEEIVNHPAILAKWKLEKNELKEQFKVIPDSEELFDQYEQVLQEEEKLRQMLFYTGFPPLFFPRIKHLLNAIDASKKYERKKVLAENSLGLELPIVEELCIEKINQKQFAATIKGTLDVDAIPDEKEFLFIFQSLCGEDKTLTDLLFKSKAYYVFDAFRSYQTAAIKEYFEVKGMCFKKEEYSFIKKGKHE